MGSSLEWRHSRLEQRLLEMMCSSRLIVALHLALPLTDQRSVSTISLLTRPSPFVNLPSSGVNNILILVLCLPVLALFKTPTCCSTSRSLFFCFCFLFLFWSCFLVPFSVGVFVFFVCVACVFGALFILIPRLSCVCVAFLRVRLRFTMSP